VDFRSPDTTRFPVGVLLSQTAATEANFSQNLRGAGINQFASEHGRPRAPDGCVDGDRMLNRSLKPRQRFLSRRVHARRVFDLDQQFPSCDVRQLPMVAFEQEKNDDATDRCCLCRSTGIVSSGFYTCTPPELIE
jgi:hypothetical protein